MNAKDVKRIRAKLELSQSRFADVLGVSVRTVQDWEQGRNTPGAPAAALLELAYSGVLMVNTVSIRDVEKSAERRPHEATKRKLLRHVAAAHRKVATLIRRPGKPKGK